MFLMAIGNILKQFGALSVYIVFFYNTYGKFNFRGDTLQCSMSVMSVGNCF